MERERERGRDGNSRARLLSVRKPWERKVVDMTTTPGGQRKCYDNLSPRFEVKKRS